MKNKYITAALLALGLLSAQAADKQSWKQWSVVVAPVYSVASSDFKFTEVKHGGGLSGELFVVDNLSVGVQAVSYDKHDAAIDEASTQLNYYVPLSASFSLVASGGILRGFQDDRSLQYKLGGGVVTSLSETFSVRTGAYIVDDFENKTELRFEASLGVRF